MQDLVIRSYQLQVHQQHLLEEWYLLAHPAYNRAEALRKNQRDFPWRKSKSAYKVWLSEIILQQTQTSQGLSYYNKILNTFPTL